MNESALVTMAVSATRPAASTDGVDIMPWRANGLFAPPLAGMFISGSVALTLQAPAGGVRGVELYGWRLSKWWLIGYLNDGADIVINGAGLGYAQEVNILGIFERLCVVGVPTTGTVTASFAPVDHWTGS
jgi:hypothetical protein